MMRPPQKSHGQFPLQLDTQGIFNRRITFCWEESSFPSILMQQLCLRDWLLVKTSPSTCSTMASSSELQYQCRFRFEFSIGNAEKMENCPWKMMIFYWKMADSYEIQGKHTKQTRTSGTFLRRRRPNSLWIYIISLRTQIHSQIDHCRPERLLLWLQWQRDCPRHAAGEECYIKNDEFCI